MGSSWSRAAFATRGPPLLCSYLIASGLNQKQVETYVGHTDIRTTFNVYGHVLEGDVDEARGALDALLEGRPQRGAALSRGVSSDALWTTATPDEIGGRGVPPRGFEPRFPP